MMFDVVMGILSLLTILGVIFTESTIHKKSVSMGFNSEIDYIRAIKSL